MKLAITSAVVAVLVGGAFADEVRFEKAPKAIDEIERVLKPRGLALLNVMSLWGVVHRFLEGVLALPVEVNRRIVRTGNLCPDTYAGSKHNAHMYRAAELRALLEGRGLTVLDMSACNCVSTVWGERLHEIRKNPAQWEHLLELELEACSEPGCLDMGTHTIAVVKKLGRGELTCHTQ